MPDQKDYKAAARDFCLNETQFHLGVIPTEQSNPLTRGLSQTIQRDTAEGVRTLLKADHDIARVALECFASDAFRRMVADLRRAMEEGRKILISSVGASGRLALQLDATWRRFWTRQAPKLPLRAAEFIRLRELSDSLMTGGDRAVARSVENFEDYMTFGARQVRDAGVGPGDVALILSECGLSASVNGSAVEADKLGLSTYYLYCNPNEILCEHLERCRKVFERERIVKIPLYVGNMAVAGSTRMQVTTVELLVAGAAQEMAIASWMDDHLTPDERAVVGASALTGREYAGMFESLVSQLSSGEALSGLARILDYEADTYAANGLITYLAHDYLQDITTDTTERQPTFTLPPFRKSNDNESPVSWAYAKDPTMPASVAWQHILHRPVKGLDWTRDDYAAMGAAQSIIDNPPSVGSGELDYYRIGWERDDSRVSRHPARLVWVDINGQTTTPAPNAPDDLTAGFDGQVRLRLGSVNPSGGTGGVECIDIPATLPRSPLDLSTHLMVKLVFNTMSTGAMAKIGRVWSNWMIQVLPTNKKLIDRSTRVIAELAGIPYEQACEEFYKSYLGRDPGETYRESYVVETLRRLGVGG
jgi:N-acetylmuramic acid 6-phosphate etherase